METALKQPITGRTRTSTGEYFSPWRSTWSVKPETITLITPADPYGRKRSDFSAGGQYEAYESRNKRRHSRLQSATLMHDLSVLLLVVCLTLTLAIAAILLL